MKVMVLDDPDRVVGALSAFRRAILATMDEPMSATEIAPRLQTSRQRVNYHLRALEEAGLVELHEERPRRGLTERVMRRVADVVLVNPSAFDTGGLDRADVVGLSGVVSVAMDLLDQAAAVSSLAGQSGQRVTAAALDTEIRVESPLRLQQMLEEIGDVIARHDTGDAGLAVRVATSVLPIVETE